MANVAGPLTSQSLEVSLQDMDSEMLRVFGIAAHGIDESILSTQLAGSSTATKTCLQRLCMLGLLTKRGTKYTHTDLGHAIFDYQLQALGKTLVAKNNDLLLGTEPEVSTSSDFPVSERLTQDILEILRRVSGQPDLRPIQVYYNWLDLSMHMAVAIGRTKEDLHIATRYMDFRTAEIAVNVARFGRRINILHGTRNGISSKLQLLGNLMANPRALKAYRSLTNNPNVMIRKAEIPYSFVIVDREQIGIEIVNPRDPDSFFIGFQIQSRNLAAKLIWYFEERQRCSVEDELGQNLKAAASTKRLK